LQLKEQEADLRKDVDTNSARLQEMQQQVQRLLDQRQALPPPFNISNARVQIDDVTRDIILKEVNPAIIDFKIRSSGSDQGTTR